MCTLMSHQRGSGREPLFARLTCESSLRGMHRLMTLQHYSPGERFRALVTFKHLQFRISINCNAHLPLVTSNHILSLLQIKKNVALLTDCITHRLQFQCVGLIGTVAGDFHHINVLVIDVRDRSLHFFRFVIGLLLLFDARCPYRASRLRRSFFSGH